MDKRPNLAEYLFMIRTIVMDTSGKCSSVNLVKNGHDYKGGHKYHGKDCHTCGTLVAQQGHSAEEQA